MWILPLAQTIRIRTYTPSEMVWPQPPRPPCQNESQRVQVHTNVHIPSTRYGVDGHNVDCVPPHSARHRWSNGLSVTRRQCSMLTVVTGSTPARAILDD